MLDMGFIVDVETILSRSPRTRQTALFSATMPYAILRICDRFMKPNPAHVTVRPDLRTVETVRQLVYFVAEQDKVAALVELNERYGFDRLLVFRHTQIGVDRLAATLKRRGKNVAALHGGLSQRERDRTLAAFRAGKIQFLIATNVASRGLDITDLPYVLSFDIPEDADTYVHRIGRTGRAGREGTAITFVGEWDLDAWEAIRAEVGAKVEVAELDLYGPGRRAELSPRATLRGMRLRISRSLLRLSLVVAILAGCSVVGAAEITVDAPQRQRRGHGRPGRRWERSDAVPHGPAHTLEPLGEERASSWPSRAGHWQVTVNGARARWEARTPVPGGRAGCRSR